MEKSGQHRISKPFKVIKDDHNELIVEEQEPFHLPIVVTSQTAMTTRKAQPSPSRTPSPQPSHSRGFPPRPSPSQPSTPQISRPSTPQTLPPLPSTTQVASAGAHTPLTVPATRDVVEESTLEPVTHASYTSGSNPEQQPNVALGRIPSTAHVITST